MIMKKKILLVLGCVILAMTNVMAQDAKREPAKEGRKKVNFEEMQLKQVLGALMLDDNTAAKFTPIYKKYQEEMKACHMPRPAKKYQDMTDDEIAKSIEEQFAHGRKMLDVKEKYYKEFKNVLNIRQIQKIYKLERSNMHRLGKEMNHRKNMKPQMGNRRPDKK